MRLSLPNYAHLAIYHASDIARFRHLIADPSKSSSAAFRFTSKPNLEGTIPRAEPFAHGPEWWRSSVTTSHIQSGGNTGHS